MRWKQLAEMEKKRIENVKREMEEARIKLEDEMQNALYDYQAEQIRQGLSKKYCCKIAIFVQDVNSWLDISEIIVCFCEQVGVVDFGVYLCKLLKNAVLSNTFYQT